MAWGGLGPSTMLQLKGRATRQQGIRADDASCRLEALDRPWGGFCDSCSLTTGSSANAVKDAPLSVKRLRHQRFPLVSATSLLRRRSRAVLALSLVQKGAQCATRRLVLALRHFVAKWCRFGIRDNGLKLPADFLFLLQKKIASAPSPSRRALKVAVVPKVRRLAWAGR